MSPHPWLAQRFAERERRGLPPRWQGSLDQSRQQMALDRAALGAGPPVHEVTLRTIAARHGPLNARVFHPTGGARAAMLYLHGGGWVMGSLQDYDALARAVAESSRCEVWLLDYRLAPEHPFPAALQDAQDALLALAQDARGLPVLIGGDSAGGNLAAVVAAQPAHAAKLHLQLLLYPVTDCHPDRAESASYRQYGQRHALDAADMDWFLAHYAAGQDLADPLLSPGRSRDLTHAAPAWMAIAGCDVLRDEALIYAQRLRAAGVAAEARLYPDMAHGFGPMFNHLEPARQMLGDMAEAIDRCLHSTAPQ